jgi:translation elongation factor EF-1alpha
VCSSDLTPVEGDYVELVGWTQSAAIKTGHMQRNILRADVVGDTMTLYINGHQVDEVQNGDIAAGSMGVEAGTASEATADTEVVFNDFTLRLP